MTGEERRQKEKELRRERILDISQRLIFERGFGNININDIADASGYTRRSIYLYFKDRDEIFFYIVRRGQLLLIDSLRKAEAEHLAGGDTVDLFCDAVFDFAGTYPEYFELILQYELRRHDYSIRYSDRDDIKSVCQNLSVDYGEIVTRAVQRDLDRKILVSELSAGQLMLVFWGQVFGFMQILIQRAENFREIYGIEHNRLLVEFKTMLKKIYSPTRINVPPVS